MSKKLTKKLNVLLNKFRKLLRRLKKIPRPVYVFLLGIFLLTFGGINYYRIRILSFSSSPTPTLQEENLQGMPENAPIPSKIIIPSIEVELSVEPAQIKDGVWEISYLNATYLKTSAPPGTNGNTIIYGHNKKTIFGNLPYLSLGQKIYIKDTEGQTHVYEAYQKDFVSPDRVDLISPTNFEELTIYTCWGLFDSQRVVIKARPI